MLHSREYRLLHCDVTICILFTPHSLSNQSLNFIYIYTYLMHIYLYYSLGEILSIL